MRCAPQRRTLFWVLRPCWPCWPSRHSCVQFLRSTFAADLHTALLASLLAILEHKANEKQRISHDSYLSQTCLSWHVFFCDFSDSELPAATSQKSDVWLLKFLRYVHMVNGKYVCIHINTYTYTCRKCLKPSCHQCHFVDCCLPEQSFEDILNYRGSVAQVRKTRARVLQSILFQAW